MFVNKIDITLKISHFLYCHQPKCETHENVFVIVEQSDIAEVSE